MAAVGRMLGTSAATAFDSPQQHWQSRAAGFLRASAVVLACRSQERGGALLAALTAEAQAQGVANPQLEVSLFCVSEQHLRPNA